MEIAKAMAKEKIKKEDGFQTINLEKTSDILADLNQKKSNSGKRRVVRVGFALETDNEEKNAAKKLTAKGLDMIVLNSLRDAESGFEFDTNKIKIINRKNQVAEFPLMSKFQAANRILTELGKLL